MRVIKNFSLKKFNTFGIDAIAGFYSAPSGIDEICALLNDPLYKNKKKLILGGGSNILFIHDFKGLVIHPQIIGRYIVTDDDDYVFVSANAGENWDEFVEWTVNEGFGGLENLSLIPGTVGACPIQNIGAYGVEVADRIEKVEAIDILSAEKFELSKDYCKFGYRNSIFKNELKNKLIITSVTFKLSRRPVLNTHYGALGEELKKFGEQNINSVRKAVIQIRESKLPNPELVPNAGSFFKNPVVLKEHADKIRDKFPDLSCYETETSAVKLAAGWMIDKLGWKGKQLGRAGVHSMQALVLINNGGAKGIEILNLANRIRDDVFKNFGVELELEVNII